MRNWLLSCAILLAVTLALRLFRTRERVEGSGTFLPVYVTNAIPSPCLFGLIRPAIYLTPDVVDDEEKLRHVLAHEETHFRHGDPDGEPTGDQGAYYADRIPT